MKKRKVMTLALILSCSAAIALPVFAATSHYTNGTGVRNEQAWDTWTQEWDSVATDYTKVSIEPGADETQLNFGWMTLKDDDKNAAVVYFGKSVDDWKAYTGTVSATDNSLTGGIDYVSNKVTVTGIEPNTTYYYQVMKNGEGSGVYTYTTKSFDDVKMLYVGDPQIGASKGQPQGDTTLSADDGAANTAARNDSYNWNRTLSIAIGLNPDISYIISAGDQVNKTGKAKEEEFAGYLNADELHSIPVATTIGNHDSLTSDYSAHFNVPNATENGMTACSSF